MWKHWSVIENEKKYTFGRNNGKHLICGSMFTTNIIFWKILIKELSSLRHLDDHFHLIATHRLFHFNAETIMVPIILSFRVLDPHTVFMRMLDIIDVQFYYNNCSIIVSQTGMRLKGKNRTKTLVGQVWPKISIWSPLFVFPNLHKHYQRLFKK